MFVCFVCDSLCDAGCVAWFCVFVVVRAPLFNVFVVCVCCVCVCLNVVVYVACDVLCDVVWCGLCWLLLFVFVCVKLYCGSCMCVC